MKALAVVHYPIFGGPHNRLLRLHQSLATRGWETIALLPEEPGNARERLVAGGIPVLQIPMRRFRASPDPRIQLPFFLRFAGDVARIRRVIRENGIDLVMVGGLINPHAGMAGRLERIPVVWQIVDSRTPRLLRLVTIPIVHRLADAVMFGGQALAELHFKGGSSAVPTFICPPPVDLDRFFPSAERRRLTRRRHSIPEDDLVVGTVSNLSPAKGVEYFVRAAALVYRQYPNTWFLVVGTRYQSHPGYTARLDEEIRRSPVPQDRFVFVGERSDVENYYPAMDVKLITSVPRSEGTTTTAMEAMASEVPVVATDVGAVREVVADGLTGFIVPPLNENLIAERTLHLLQSPGIRRQFGTEARRRAREFSVAACTDRYLEVFDAAIAHRRAAPYSRAPSPIL